MNPNVIEDYQKLKDQAPVLVRRFRGAMSYGHCAKLLDCSKSYLWKVEHGQAVANDEFLRRLMHLLENP